MSATPPPGAHPDSYVVITVLTSGQVRFWTRDGLSKDNLVRLLHTMADDFDGDHMMRVE